MTQRPVKLLKNDKQNIINHHFSKTNQRLTNVSKSTVKQLDDIILKYSIDINDYYKEKEKEEKEEKEEEEIKQIKNNKETEFYKNELKKHMHTVECQTFILNKLEADRLKNNESIQDRIRQDIQKFKHKNIQFEQIDENTIKAGNIYHTIGHFIKNPYTLEYILKNISYENNIFRQYVDNFKEPEVESITAQESKELERRQREEDEEEEDEVGNGLYGFCKKCKICLVEDDNDRGTGYCEDCEEEHRDESIKSMQFLIIEMGKKLKKHKNRDDVLYKSMKELYKDFKKSL